MVRTSGLLHPIALAALVIWIANDYWLAKTYPSWLTGKLSDVAGLIVFPLVIAALVGVGLPGRLYPRVVDGVLIACGIAFVLIKLWDPAADVAARLLRLMQPGNTPVVARDATDLIALPMLIVSRWCYRTARRRKGEDDAST